MKRQVFVLAGMLLAASVAHAGPVTEARSPGNFHAVELRGALDIDLQIGNATRVEVSAESDIIKQVTTTIKDGKLIIQTPDKMRDGHVHVSITAPSIDALSLSGAGHLHATGVAASNLALSISGAGDLEVTGSADTVAVDMSGAGEVRTKDLNAKSVTIDVNGTGNAIVTATSSLTASLSGVGNVEVYGHPKAVTKHVNGIGHIKLR
jgi:hypothetical protein